MTLEDLQHIRAGTGWRHGRVEVFHGTSLGSVLVKGQRAPRPAWRYRVLDGFAMMAGLSALRAVPAHGGTRAQQIEVQRLRSLAAAGVPVQALLHVDERFIVQSLVAGKRLDIVLRRGGADALRWWQRGLQSLVALHARDQYLSQAFARNFIASGEQLVMIDFEDDPLEVMTLDQAQARDWLAYLHSSARVLWSQAAEQRAQAVALLRTGLASEREAVHKLLARMARRLGGLRRLPAGDGNGWRRHLAIAGSAAALLHAAGVPAPRSSTEPTSNKADHARHH